ncbi:MAG TPA: DMT family transporter [Candidatus Poseidoniales archaeon]|nr:MAG TPA: DMT family transporter [Candidatus Poseidoniales archaeon]HII28053.1 DMT family transporter [Poseidonia sp.]
MAVTNTPLWVWGLLVAAVFGVSSAGALFQSVDTVPPLLRASWRLQLTAIVLLPLFLQQIATIEPAIMEQVKTRRALLLLFASGLALAAHFGAWVASLDQTTLTHSLLFVTAHPLVIVVGMAVLAPLVARVRRPLRTETIGAIICFVGAGVTLLDAGSDQGDQTVSVLGDLLAFGGAVFVVGYIVIGRILRTWMPIFVYAFPVTLIGGLVLLPCSWWFEPNFAEFGAAGWVDPAYFQTFLALALFAGLLGHTGLNTCLRYISPLVVSISVTMEPVLGSIIGWVFFETGVPGFWTQLGGLVLMTGLMTVVVAGERASLNEANNQNSPS